MEKSWEEEPKDRPEFGDIVAKLSEIDVLKLREEEVEDAPKKKLLEKPKIDYQLSVSLTGLNKYTQV